MDQIESQILVTLKKCY